MVAPKAKAVGRHDHGLVAWHLASWQDRATLMSDIVAMEGRRSTLGRGSMPRLIDTGFAQASHLKTPGKVVEADHERTSGEPTLAPVSLRRRLRRDAKQMGEQRFSASAERWPAKASCWARARH